LEKEEEGCGATTSLPSSLKEEQHPVLTATVVVLLTNMLILIQTIKLAGRDKISETIEFPKKFTIVGNLTLAFWIALDIVAFLLINIVGGAYFFWLRLLPFMVCSSF
jgi:hypothetical protein